MVSRFMSRLGIGGAQVDTVLDSPAVRPGGSVTGQVRITGGKVDQDVQQVRLSLTAVVESESGDSEWREDVDFAVQVVAEALHLEPGRQQNLGFALEVPWEAPITTVGGWHLRGMSVGVRTRLDIAGAIDPGDLDPIAIQPLPVQQAVLDSLADLGFRFHSADLERGRLHGSRLPFYQEIEFYPPGSLARNINQLEVTFVTDPQGVDVVLEADRRGGLLTEGRDAVSRLRLSHQDTDRHRLAGLLNQEVQHLGRRRGWL